jgi:chromosome transmission fidelity protein 18
MNKSRGKKKADKGKQVLRRPIICICNDLYASSLAKLRPLARVIRFTRPADIHVVKRLRDICDIEGLRTDSRALSTLVGIALGDMRGCLNTLQVVHVVCRRGDLPDCPLPVYQGSKSRCNRAASS